MTDRSIHELRVGDWIADMHYGAEQLRERFAVVLHLRWDEPQPKTRMRMNSSGYVDHPFFSYLQEFVEGCYGNKALHVIGFADDSTLTHPVLICAYCYDGFKSGIVLLKEKSQ